MKAAYGNAPAGPIFILALAAAAILAASSTALASNDPLFARQWALQKIQAEPAWGLASGGVTVAVVDTGVAFGHPDLSGKSAGAVNCINTACHGGGDVDDYNGHGTEVAGIIGAHANNTVGIAPVAPAAGILSVMVLGPDGSGSGDDVIRGIHYAADHGARVINLSLGPDIISGAFDILCLGCGRGDFQAAFEYAASKGTLVVAAAGNDGLNSFYAGMNNVMVVGATGPSDEGAWYSSSGAHIFAPGGNAGGACTAEECILTTCTTRKHAEACNRGAGYRPVQGTSFAAPHVSGVGALLMSQGFSYTGAIERMKATADGGRVNACKAVGGCGASPLPPPAERAAAPAAQTPAGGPQAGAAAPAEGPAAPRAPGAAPAAAGKGNAPDESSTQAGASAPGTPGAPQAPAAPEAVSTIELGASESGATERGSPEEKIGGTKLAFGGSSPAAMGSLVAMAVLLVSAFAVPRLRSRRRKG